MHGQEHCTHVLGQISRGILMGRNFRVARLQNIGHHPAVPLNSWKAIRGPGVVTQPEVWPMTEAGMGALRRRPWRARASCLSLCMPDMPSSGLGCIVLTGWLLSQLKVQRQELKGQSLLIAEGGPQCLQGA